MVILKCFYYALRGILAAAESERNMRIHLAFAFYVIVTGIITQLSLAEWTAVLLCIALVLSAECVNTAIEKVCDELHPEKSKLIGKAKDLSAGAVLVCSVVAAIIGGNIFFRAAKVRELLTFCREKPVWTAILLLTAAAWLYLIIAWRKKNDD